MTRHPAGGAVPSRPVAGVVLLAALLAVGGCGTDATTVYRESAVAALEAVLSEARTAELAGRLWVDGQSTHPLAVVVVGESEAGVGSEGSWFEEQQPPEPGGDATRERTLRALDGATSAVQGVRIALDRSDRRATRAALDELRSACADVQSLAEELG
jgi:hypothetical protein